VSEDDFDVERAVKRAELAAKVGATRATKSKLSREAVATVVASARRSGEVVVFDARPLLGAIASDAGASTIAIGLEGAMVTLERAKLAKIATTLRAFPRVAASFDPRGRARVSFRWARADGSGGGVDFTGPYYSPPDAKPSIAVVFPADIQTSDEASPLGASPRPVWSTASYIDARIKDQQVERDLDALSKRDAEARARSAERVEAAKDDASRAATTSCGRAAEAKRAPSPVMVEAGRKAYATKLRNAASRGDVNAAAKLAALGGAQA
jgi:hypothetical protein